MQYLNIAVNSKTDKIDQLFTYKITPELLPSIKRGILVEVPFGNRNKEGIILSLKHLNTGTSKHKLKTINKIIDPTPIIDGVRLELAKWMSQYYMTSLAKVIFFMLPDVARREVKKITNYELRIMNNGEENQKQITNMSFRLERSSVEKSLYSRDSLSADRQARLKPALSEVEWARNDKPNQVFGLYNSKQNRIRNYIQLIQKAQVKNRGVILLFPDWLANNKYIDTIYERFGNDITLLDPHKTKTEFFRSWDELRSGKKNIAIGTRNSIFAPVVNLGLIIIDEPEDFGYKEEQTVHYHVREVSKYLAKITGANLVYGSGIPQLTDYYWQKLKKIKFLQHSDIRKNVGMFNKIKIIDGAQEKSIIGYQIEQKISEALKENKKVLILTNRKSQGFLCADCGNIFCCPRCNNVLQYQANNLLCPSCNHKENPPVQCPNCNGHNLRSFGTSVQSIQKELKQLLPQKKIVAISESNYELRITNYDIIISTPEIFRHSNVNFDLTIIPSWEHLQFGSDINEKQNIINTIVKLLEITKNKLIIQTKNPEDALLQNIASGKVEKIYEQELVERKKYQYPPFYKLVKLIYKHKDSKTAQKEINKLDYELRKLLPKIEILGPTETRKLRDKFYWQIILKISAKLYPQVNKLLISREKELQLSKYLIDIDPLRLI